MRATVVNAPSAERVGNDVKFKFLSSAIAIDANVAMPIFE
jgi:hypothetical protein